MYMTTRVHIYIYTHTHIYSYIRMHSAGIVDVLICLNLPPLLLPWSCFPYIDRASQCFENLVTGAAWGLGWATVVVMKLMSKETVGMPDPPNPF